MQIHHLAILETNSLSLLEQLDAVSTDAEHVLAIVTDPELCQSASAKQALARGDMVGVLISKNPRFVGNCARAAFALGPRTPLPIKKDCLRLELSGKPLTRLLKEAKKYDEIMQKRQSRLAAEAADVPKI